MFENRNDLELCEENCHTRLSHSKHLLKNIIASDVSIVSVHWQKDIYNSRTEKPTEGLTECICSDQEERRRNKMPVHTINVQSLTASVGEPQVVDSAPVWYLSITESRLTRPHYCNVMLLQQFLLAIRQISSKFFIFQQDSAPVHSL